MENNPLRGLFGVSSPCPEPQLDTPQPTCSDPTSDGQVSVLQCHPWIGNADTHSTRRIYNRVAITHYYIECLQRELITIIWLKAI